MVDGLAADWSGANSASFVASQNRAKYTGGSEFPAAGCYLKIAGEIPARESYLTLFEICPWHRMPRF
jgi:hypothetical protein